MNKILLWPAAALLGLNSLSANAIAFPPILNDYGFNVDNTVSNPLFGDPVPANVNLGAFDDWLGLGTITASFSGDGAHNFDVYFDHDISQTVDNEQGSTIGSAASGQSWEIDSAPIVGDIDLNMEASALDNLNQALVPDDIAMAMGWDFTLTNGQTAEITLSLMGVDLLLQSPVVPSGFSLVQSNLVNGGSNYDIYLSGELIITGCGSQCGPGGPGDGKVPEPSIMLLMGLGLAGMVVSRRKTRV